MSQSQATTPAANGGLLSLPPLFRIGIFAQVLRERFPEVRQSLTLICEWYEQAKAWLLGRSAAVRAIDDELEQAAARLREHLPLFAQALANDAPALRKQLLADLALVLRASDLTHANTESTAATLLPPECI